MSRLSLPHVTRETRLLTATLVVSILALFILARFRYPAPEPAGAPPTAQPLARLAAAAAYDELAATIERLEPRILPSLVVVRVDSGDMRGAFEPLIQPLPAVELPRFVPALRVRDDRAVALLPRSARIQRAVDSPETATVVATDPVRGVVLFKVASSERPPAIPRWESGTALSTPRYVAVAEGTRGGPTLRPLFLGSTDAVADAGWGASLLALSDATAAPIGSFVFSLDGRLAGVIADVEGAPAMVPADTLMRMSDRLASDAPLRTGDLGLVTQALTPALAVATGAEFGAVVAFVDPTGPVAETVRIGDVIWAINGETTRSVGELDTQVARTQPGTPITLSLTRMGQKLEVDAVVREHDERRSFDTPGGLGLALRQIEGLGCEVMRVSPRSAAAHAGLAPGDLIVQLGNESAPTSSTVQRLYRVAESGSVLLVGVERRGKHLVLGLRK